MRRATLWASLFVVLCGYGVVSAPAAAGEFNATLKLGDQGPAWQELPGTDGKPHSLDDLKQREVVVVVFTCNSCPYAVDYEDRVNDLARRHAAADSRVAVVAINVNRIEADLLPAMQKRAEEKKFVFPYLYDASQQIAKAYGATRTPEFFVLNRERQVVYMGAMDDNTKSAEVKLRYVEDAIAATLAGKKPAKAETPPIGCLIRYVRERRK